MASSLRASSRALPRHATAPAYDLEQDRTSPRAASLTTIFSPAFLDEVESRQESLRIQRLESDMRPAAYESLTAYLDRLYAYMLRCCRSEYVFKNELIRRHVLRKARLHNTTVLNELRFAAGARRADIVAVNGTTTAYEVKSDYDSLERLEEQVDAALNVFGEVVVVASQDQASTLLDTLDERCGILALTDDGSFLRIRTARDNRTNVDPVAIMLSLRAQDVQAAVQRNTGLPPPRTRSAYEHYDYNAKFMRFPRLVAHRELCEALTRRFYQASQLTDLKRLPWGFAGLYYRVKPSERKRLFSQTFLEQPIVRGRLNETCTFP